MSITWKLIIVSLAIGLAASLLPTLGLMFFPGPFGGIRTAVLMLINITPMLLWMTRSVFFVARYGTKGLWFLIGLPLGVLWPLCVFAIWWACAAHWSCF